MERSTCPICLESIDTADASNFLELFLDANIRCTPRVVSNAHITAPAAQCAGTSLSKKTPHPNPTRRTTYSSVSNKNAGTRRVVPSLPDASFPTDSTPQPLEKLRDRLRDANRSCGSGPRFGQGMDKSGQDGMDDRSKGAKQN